MTALSAFVILVMVSVVAFAMAAPFLYWRRRRRAAQDRATTNPLRNPLTWRQVLPGLLGVAALFSLLAQEYIAPQSWLGSRLATPEGKYWLLLLGVLVYAVLGGFVHLLTTKWKSKRRGAKDVEH